MCGIAGKISLNGRVDERLLKKMAGVLKHRGPDGEGVYTDNAWTPFAGLAHVRLSIIDLATGDQPMPNEDKTLWVVQNGEIYNFQELKENLIKKGHSFRTKSDTEVLLHLYEEKKEAMLEDLRGAFAFAIWDTKNKKLFAARDRVGQKPFNYYYDGKNFIFGSEIKAILEDSTVKKEIDFFSMDFYLTYGYTPLERSIFSGIKKLPPAHFLTLDAKGLRLEKYWELGYDKPKKHKKIEEYEEGLLDILKEAVKLRLTSDVPLGAFLSGGVDSSVVVALMSRIAGGRVKTFTIGFDSEDYSEIKYARRVAEIFGTEHKEFIVTPDTIKNLEKLVWYYNEPYADSSSLPSYYVAKNTSEYVKVALNGDGGDESFAGYDRYKGIRLSASLGFLPREIFSMGSGTLSYLNRFFKGKTSHFLARRKAFLHTMYKYNTSAEKYAYWMSVFTNEDKEALYKEGFKSATRVFDQSHFVSDKMAGAKATNSFEKAMKTDIETNLPGDLTVKMDIATMANSLEARSPFLDHKLMEFAASIPAEMKLRGFTSKYIIKKLASKFLPKEVLFRKKMGFAAPIGKWFNHELKDYVSDVLLDKKALERGYFKEESVKNLISEQQKGIRNNEHKLWALLNLELWHKRFVDSSKRESVCVE